MTRPETHQNLIHPDKEQNRQLMTINVGEYVLSQERYRHDPVTFPRVKAVFNQQRPLAPGNRLWRQPDSNR
jgi:hypothetical protein